MGRLARAISRNGGIRLLIRSRGRIMGQVWGMWRMCCISPMLGSCMSDCMSFKSSWSTNASGERPIHQRRRSAYTSITMRCTIGLCARYLRLECSVRWRKLSWRRILMRVRLLYSLIRSRREDVRKTYDCLFPCKIWNEGQSVLRESSGFVILVGGLGRNATRVDSVTD